MTTAWRPLLDGNDRDRALAIAARLARAVIAHRIDATPSLLGRAGITVFCAYAESAGIIDPVDVASLLAECIQLASTLEMPIGLWNGCTGLRWAVAHLADGEIAQAITTRLDTAIEHALRHAPADLSFDLYSGLAGILLAYAEDCSPSGSRITRLVIDRLVAIDWAQLRSLPGCAHGIAGVVAALATFVATGHGAIADRDAMARARGLLRQLVARLVAADPRGLRLSWCSGGPGVALGLLAAARALRDDGLARRAIATALVALAPSGNAPPGDATLCHGAAGLAHISNRLYQATGRAELADHARAWLRRTMDVAIRRRADPSLLVGAAGVGLTLLAAATPLAPRWDRTLAADLPI
jgi:lantibiotic modifying enzyme